MSRSFVAGSWLEVARAAYLEELYRGRNVLWLGTHESRLVELRYFGGLTIDETAEVMQTSAATVSREWSSARAWLFRELSRGAAQ